MKYFKKAHFQSTTIQRLFFLFLLIYLPLLLCISAIGSYGKHLLKQQTILYNHNTISLQLTTTDTQLGHISNYLASFLLDEKNYKELLAGRHREEHEVEILNSFTDYLNTYNSCATLFFYLPEQDSFIMQSADYDTFSERRQMESYIRERCQDSLSSDRNISSTGWTLIQNNEQNYLVQLMEYQNVYVGSWEICRYLFEDFHSLEENTKGTITISDRKGIEFPLFPAKDEGITLPNKKNCVTIPVDSETNQYRISLCIPEKYVLDAFRWFHTIIFALMGITILIFLFLLLAAWRQMVAPLIRMIDAMEAVQQGDFDTTLPVPNTGDEFEQLTTTFNYMIQKIHTLKIQVYEEKLNQVYAELQYLTLQIKPHFFLNCLNILYSLGLSGRSALVAEFSSTLMKYFRYLFKSSDSMVTIEQEIEHIEHYLHIQKIRFQNDLDCQFELQEETRSMPIPVLLLHTFVENIFKHAYTDVQKMQIYIHTYIDSAAPEPCLVLVIRDNGKGYPPQQLSLLNSMNPADFPSTKEGSHIGISNVKRRLIHLYGDKLSLHFENLLEGGASITLHLPITNIQLEELHDKPITY